MSAMYSHMHIDICRSNSSLASQGCWKSLHARLSGFSGSTLCEACPAGAAPPSPSFGSWGLHFRQGSKVPTYGVSRSSVLGIVTAV